MSDKWAARHCCVDVFAVEPPTDDELLNAPNFLCTPHIGGSAEEARLAMGKAAIEGIENNFLPEPGVFPLVFIFVTQINFIPNLKRKINVC